MHFNYETVTHDRFLAFCETVGRSDEKGELWILGTSNNLSPLPPLDTDHHGEEQFLETLQWEAKPVQET